MKRICIIGAGRVGLVVAACFAKMGNKITVVDIDESKIAEINSRVSPIAEPGLDEIVKSSRDKNLFFSTDIQGGIRESDIIFVSVNTPTKTFGAGAGMAADLQFWEKTAREIRKHARSDKIVVEKSTLPVKTALAMERILASARSEIRFQVISNERTRTDEQHCCGSGCI